MHSISFESSDIGKKYFCLAQSVAALLGHFLFGQGYPIFVAFIFPLARVVVVSLLTSACLIRTGLAPLKLYTSTILHQLEKNSS